ncbi:MAG TPA: DUF1015 family protein [Kofleriaceae bacterium]|nr:DUF1015 family protein [Kofleriaceae bacterium]
MPQIAGLRGVLPEASKLKEVVETGAGFDAVKAFAAGTLVRDPGRAVYRYHQVFAEPGGARTVVRKMFLCSVRLEPWNEGLVKPHEATVPEHKVAALAALQASRLQPRPVVAGFRDAPNEVERLFRGVDGMRPTFEVTTPDRTVHRLWRAQNAEMLGQLRHTFAPKKLTVLEGHALYEALLAYRDELAAKQPLAMYASPNYALMCLVNLDDPVLAVVPRHRVIRGGPSSQAALAAAKRTFIIEKLPGAGADLDKQRAALGDSVAHQPAFVVAWRGEPDAWKLTLSPEVSPINEGVQVHRALQRLVPVVADQMFVERVLTGAKVEALAGGDNPLAAKADAVLIMQPLSVEQIHHIAELGEVVPTGSSALHPRLAQGLVAAVIDPDEDVV